MPYATPLHVSLTFGSVFFLRDLLLCPRVSTLVVSPLMIVGLFNLKGDSKIDKVSGDHLSNSTLGYHIEMRSFIIL